jgi:hypothetical protein
VGGRITGHCSDPEDKGKRVAARLRRGSPIPPCRHLTRGRRNRSPWLVGCGRRVAGPSARGAPVPLTLAADLLWNGRGVGLYYFCFISHGRLPPRPGNGRRAGESGPNFCAICSPPQGQRDQVNSRTDHRCCTRMARGTFFVLGRRITPPICQQNGDKITCRAQELERCSGCAGLDGRWIAREDNLVVPHRSACAWQVSLP